MDFKLSQCINTNLRMRVRTILSSISSAEKNELIRLLPERTVCPPLEKTNYPSMLLSCLPKENSYSYLGIIAESLLRSSIDINTLLALSDTLVDPSKHESIRKSKTTDVFLDKIKETQSKIHEVKIGELMYDIELKKGSVEGHPDIMTPHQVFEVKLTCLARKNWIDFLLQTYSYVALNPEITDLYIVLPLQTKVWHRCVRTWENREKYFETLNHFATHYSAIDTQTGSVIQSIYGIGCHIKKHPTLLDTVKQIDGRAPYQIFLGGPQCSKVSVKDLDIAATHEHIEQNGLSIYVHTPYILNLATEFKEGEWQYDLFRKYIEVSVAMGAKGVVIHVAKHTKQSYENAVMTMKKNLDLFKQFATIECPILLETPAGQGTETLKDMKEFCEFVNSFSDERIRVCVDTCHIFACGHDPLEYITYITTEHTSMLKLVHYNDSKDVCGSCLDRHAYIGTGNIGIDKMTRIAMYCRDIGIPMVVE